MVGLGCLGVVALVAIIGIAAAAGGGGGDKSDTSVSAPDRAAVPAKDDAKDEAKPKKDLSQAEEFQAFVAKNGTATEKAAAKHVTKIQGADKRNDILDSADIYTNYSGGMMGPHQGEGKLLASAFADWKDSDNGLVTVYDKKGELLANGQF
ncbi:hypothetical protein HY68_01550 [Streptomyces sp. AcH 505]|nr:hypothetical protein HY68_01550 [Streptomyces sp. AcH 505]